MAGKLVQQDGDAIDGAAALEMGLDLLGRGAVIDVADEDAARIDILLVLAQLVRLLVQRRLHLAQLRRLGLHLLDALLHGGDLFLRVEGSFVSMVGERNVWVGEERKGLIAWKMGVSKAVAEGEYIPH